MAIERLRVMRGSRRAVSVLSLTVLAAASAQAQRILQIQPSVQATVTASDNPLLVDTSAAKSDLITDLSGTVDILWRTQAIAIDGRLAAHALAYANGSGRNHLLPEGWLNLRSTVLERWLYLDGGFQASQAMANSFSGNDLGVAGSGRVTSLNYRLAPRLQHEFTPSLTLTVKPERTWVHRIGETTALSSRGYQSDDHAARLVQRPLPFGWMVEATQQDTRYDGIGEAVLDIRTARGGINFAAAPDLTVGVTAGRESAKYGLVDQQDSTVGLSLDYRPTERTSLVGTAERRFFGVGLDVEVRHRSPFFSLMGRVVRRPNAQPTTQLMAAGGSTVSLLDALLTTRVPDPVLRAEQVRQLMTQLGLPDTLRYAIQVYVDSARLEQAAEVMFVLQGRVTTLTFSASANRLEPLKSLAALSVDLQSSQQAAGGVALNRRLDPLTAVTIELRGARIEGLGARLGERTTSGLLGGSVSRQLTARTTVAVTARRRLVRSNVAGQPSGAESAVSMGVSHQF